MNKFYWRLHRFQLLCFLVVSMSFYLQGQTKIHVTSLDNSVITYPVKSEGKVWFDNGSMWILEDNATNAISIAISSIRKVTLEEGTTNGQHEIFTNNNVYIFPNPANTYFDLKAEGQSTVDIRIFDTKGILLVNGIYEDGSRIDISCLEKGTYVVVANSQSFKLIKL